MNEYMKLNEERIKPHCLQFSHSVITKESRILNVHLHVDTGIMGAGQWAKKNWGGLLCPFGCVELGPLLIQCHLGQGLPPYQVAS